MLGRLGHPPLLTFTPSQKKHQETLDWGLRRDYQGSTLVWSLLPGCPSLPGVSQWGQFSWRQPSGGSGQNPPSEGEFTVPRPRLPRPLNRPNERTQHLLWGLLEAGRLESSL